MTTMYLLRLVGLIVGSLVMLVVLTVGNYVMFELVLRDSNWRPDFFTGLCVVVGILVEVLIIIRVIISWMTLLG